MSATPSLDASDHVRGPEDATLLILLYGDYDCPHTRRASVILLELERDLGLAFRFAFRHFPLRHLHEHAEELSEISEAATLQGRFWEVHDFLMDHHRFASSEQALSELFARGIDVDDLRRHLGSDEVTERVERDVLSGRAVGVRSTPTWFVNGALWDGHYDRATLEERIRVALAPSQEGAAS